MSGFGVEVRDLTVRYGSTTALDAVSFRIRPGVITGLLGRNGSGKTTALSALAAFLRKTSGTVLVDGEEPWENARTMGGTMLVRESGETVPDRPVGEMLRLYANRRDTFDTELADKLLDLFELDVKDRPDRLSRGKKSAFGVVVGIASRAPLTLLDEVHLGMDAPSRYTFYDALLADWLEHPRTIVLSSHLISEIERLLEDVVLLDRGTVLMQSDADTLRGRGLTVTGRAQDVETFVAGREVVARQRLGTTAQATVIGSGPEDGERARALQLELGPVPLQDLFVHLTDHPKDPATERPTPTEAAR